MTVASYLILGTCLLTLLAMGILFPENTLLLGISTGILTLIGGSLVLLIYRRNHPARFTQLVRSYLQYTEVLYDSFSKRKSIRQQVENLATFISSELGSERVLIFTRKGREFVAVTGVGVDKSELRKAKFNVRDPLISTIESERIVVHLSRFSSTANHNHPLMVCRLDYVVPLISGNRCTHLIAASESRLIPFKLSSPFLLALADQLGNIKYFEDNHSRNNQQIAKLKKLIGSLKQEVSVVRKQPEFDSRAMLKAQDKLIRIRDIEYLYSKILELIKEHLNSDFTLLFLRDESTNVYKIKYQLDAPGKLVDNLELKFSEEVIKKINQPDGPVLLNTLGKSIKHESVIAELIDIGVDVVSLLPGKGSTSTLLAFSRKEPVISDKELTAVHSLCRLFELVLENLEHFNKIEELSYTDEMTGLYNYRYFYKRLREEILRAKRFDRHLALVIFDIDEFKVFNDTYGHQSGDHLLKQLGDLLAKSGRSIDIVSRYGGEEFCVIMPETNKESCVFFMERMRMAILNHQFEDKFSDEYHRVTISLGGAIYPNDAQRVDRLIYCADMALLQAKNSGRNRAFMFNEDLAITR